MIWTHRVKKSKKKSGLARFSWFNVLIIVVPRDANTINFLRVGSNLSAGNFRWENWLQWLSSVNASDRNDGKECIFFVGTGFGRNRIFLIVWWYFDCFSWFAQRITGQRAKWLFESRGIELDHYLDVVINRILIAIWTLKVNVGQVICSTLLWNRILQP